jgi:hypothetical protein
VAFALLPRFRRTLPTKPGRTTDRWRSSHLRRFQKKGLLTIAKSSDPLAGMPSERRSRQSLKRARKTRSLNCLLLLPH